MRYQRTVAIIDAMSNPGLLDTFEHLPYARKEMQKSSGYARQRTVLPNSHQLPLTARVTYDQKIFTVQLTEPDQAACSAFFARV